MTGWLLTDVAAPTRTNGAEVTVEEVDLLPATVTVTWEGQTGTRTMTFTTMLSRTQLPKG